jgi:hypothetical protein
VRVCSGIETRTFMGVGSMGLDLGALVVWGITKGISKFELPHSSDRANYPIFCTFVWHSTSLEIAGNDGNKWVY